MPLVPPISLDTPGHLTDSMHATIDTFKGLEPLYSTVLHSPSLADCFAKLCQGTRIDNILDVDFREIMVLRIAVLNRASYEWVQHESYARAAGVSTEQLIRIGDVNQTMSTLVAPGPGQFTHIQSLAVHLADAITIKVQVEDTTMVALRAAFLAQGNDEATTNRLLVEAVMICAAYNMVSRVLVALDVDGRANVPCPVPQQRASL